jgi:hypothetical protein
VKSKTRDWITVSGISSGKQFESGVIHLSDHSQAIVISRSAIAFCSVLWTTNLQPLISIHTLPLSFGT